MERYSYTAKEVAQAIGMGYKWVLEQIKFGKLKAKKSKKDLLIKKEELDEFFDNLPDAEGIDPDSIEI